MALQNNENAIFLHFIFLEFRDARPQNLLPLIGRINFFSTNQPISVTLPAAKIWLKPTIEE
jgi:hypothetical protein